MKFDRQTLLAALLLLGVFVSGAVVGGVAVLVLAAGHPPPPFGREPHPPGPPGPPPPARVVDDLRRELDLDEAQAASLLAIVTETGAGIERALDESETKMRAVLRPEQQRRFDGFIERRKSGRPPGPPRGPRDEDDRERPREGPR